MQGVKIDLTDGQLAWFVENFPNLPNSEICEHLGCGESSVHRLARKHGLVKGESFLEWRADKAKDALRLHYKIHKHPGNPEAIRKYRYQKGHDPRITLGEEKFREAIRRGAETRREIARVERARISFGLPQQTRMHLKKQPRQKIWQRCYLKKRGYILDEKNNIAYYTPDTHRARRLEGVSRGGRKGTIAPYYDFKPYPL